MAPKTIVITGCSKGGIGYWLAKEFAAREYHVFATSRNVETMGDLASMPNISVLSLDINSESSIASAYSIISQKTDGHLDILYQNAGYRSLAMGIETSTSEALKMFQTNFLSVVELNRIFGPMVVKAKGKIVFTGSVSGRTPHPTQSVYNSTKAALELYTKTLRLEMWPLGVQVLHVLTGGVNTGMSSSRLELAADSSFKYLETKINASWEDMMTSGTMDCDAYAKIVVPKVLQGQEEIWCGASWFDVWIVEFLNAQRWVYPAVFGRMFGMNRKAPSGTPGGVLKSA